MPLEWKELSTQFPWPAYREGPMDESTFFINNKLFSIDASQGTALSAIGAIRHC
jgi:hypothetical protein